MSQNRDPRRKVMDPDHGRDGRFITLLRIAHRSILALATAMLGASSAAAQTPPRFEVTIDPKVHPGPVTGRLIVIASTRAEPEPRLTISPSGPAIFGIDLEQHPAGKPAIVGADAIGYPTNLPELPAGEYHVQAYLRVYSEVHRADGHRLWLPMNDGTIEPFNAAAGSLVSDVRKVRIGDGTVALTLTRKLPPNPRPADTEWLRHVTIQSAKLTAFWGRPIYVHATALLPKGYHEETSRRYPAIYALGHNVPFGFRTDSTGSGHGTIHPVTGVETGFDFYKAWSAPDFPRVIAITLQQQTPYFPDSYSVNSANNGPYGDAVVEEIIPELERRFRILAEPHARHLEGASTSGWQSLALQLRYPDYFGGAWILQPDPIDFTRYQLVDIYRDENAFTIPVGQGTAERPFRRTVEGQTVWTVRQLSRFEAVLGSKSRSGFQLAAWEAVFGPVGPDGYPKPLWDPLTGRIDRSVAEAMRANGFDLRDYAERSWATLAPKLRGKLRFFTGDMDDFYLNLAVYRFEEFTRRANPPSDAEFVYGRPMKGHSWHAFPWAELVRRFARAVEEATPR